MIHLLTWHGAVLRIDAASGQRIHAFPWPRRAIAEDLTLDTTLDQLPTSLALPGAPPCIAWVSMQGRALNVRHEDSYLCAEPDQGIVSFRRRSVGDHEKFLPLAPAELAVIRDLMSHGWTIGQTTEVVSPGDVVMQAGFVLCIGQARVPLLGAIPHPAPGGADTLIALADDGAVLHLRRGPLLPPRREVALLRRPPHQPAVPDAPAFQAAPEASLMLAGETDYTYLPMVVKTADQDWMYGRSMRPEWPRVGPYNATCRLVHERDKFVLLSRWKEGMVFDSAGVSNETGYLFTTHVTARGLFLREGDTVLIDEAALDAAPRLRGPHVSIVNGNAINYYHWTIDGLLPLFILRPYLPPDVTLLMPQTLLDCAGTPGQVDHMAALRAWGMDDMKMVVAPPPVCHVEEIYWLDHGSPLDFPAAVFHAARAAVLGRLGPPDFIAPGAKRRIYIPRRGIRRVANEAAVEHALRPYGFESILMENYPPAEQISMFRDAEMVVGPHGAGLSNIMFCAPGARVMEFMPQQEYRSFFADISDKLGHAHAVLPCPTSDHGFQGEMTVDIGAMRSLLDQLAAWRTA
jgi:hypothetical protein